MDRREFLKGLLGAGALAAVSPKLIFDMGKNSRIYTPQYELLNLQEADNLFKVVFRELYEKTYFTDATIFHRHILINVDHAGDVDGV